MAADLDSNTSLLAVAHGFVIAAVMGGNATASKAIVEWTTDSAISAIVRMPHAAVPLFYRQPWPGREAALAILAQKGTPDAT